MLDDAETVLQNRNTVEVVAAQSAGPVRAKIDKVSIGRECRVEISLWRIEWRRRGDTPTGAAAFGNPDVVFAGAAAAISGEPCGGVSVRAQGQSHIGGFG